MTDNYVTRNFRAKGKDSKARRKWIQGATQHKGTLTRWAKAHGFVTPKGTIDLARASAFAEKSGSTKRIRQVDLARTLRHFHRNGTPCHHKPPCGRGR